MSGEASKTASRNDSSMTRQAQQMGCAALLKEQVTPCTLSYLQGHICWQLAVQNAAQVRRDKAQLRVLYSRTMSRTPYLEKEGCLRDDTNCSA